LALTGHDLERGRCHVSPDEPEHDAISVQAPDDRIYGGEAQRRSLEVEAASPAHSEAAAARYVEIVGRNLHPTVARRGLRIHGDALVAESMPGGNVRADRDLRIARLLRGAAHCLTRSGQCPITECTGGGTIAAICAYARFETRGSGLVKRRGAERVAMQVTGCRTRSVFDRYRIVGPADPRDVARRITGTIPGTTG